MKIALIGYGKMGKAIERVATARGHDIVLKIDVDNRGEMTKENLSKAEVAIEFTGPSSALENLRRCAETPVPVICGSTGWLKEYSEIENLYKQNGSAFLYASNFSIGVNIFFELNRKLATLMANHPEYAIELKEIHHTQKKDAPSGTAITLAEQIMQAIPSFTHWVNRPGDNASELPILSERVDPAPGTHEIKYQSPIDDIQIIHTAHSREGFASGAVLAAEYIGHKKGIFTMKDVLGF